MGTGEDELTQAINALIEAVTAQSQAITAANDAAAAAAAADDKRRATSLARTDANRVVDDAVKALGEVISKYADGDPNT